MKFAVLAVVWAALFAAPALADPHTLTVTGHGACTVEPDMVMISAGVTTSAATARQAVDDNNARMHAVQHALDKLGVPLRAIQTANFSVSPQYANTPNQPQRLTGYQVNNELAIELDDVGKLGAALDALVTAGANQMNGISFSVQAIAEPQKKAREDAVENAKIRARTFAAAAGVTLGPVLSISDAGGSEARPMRLAAPMLMARAVPVSTGEQAITADVQMVWEIH